MPEVIAEYLESSKKLILYDANDFCGCMVSASCPGPYWTEIRGVAGQLETLSWREDCLVVCELRYADLATHISFPWFTHSCHKKNLS